MTILQVCRRGELEGLNSTTGNEYSPAFRRLPRWISNAASGPVEKNSCNCSRDACSRAESVSIMIPVSWSCVCQACRNRFAAASAGPYAGSLYAELISRELFFGTRASEMEHKIKKSRSEVAGRLIRQS